MVEVSYRRYLLSRADGTIKLRNRNLRRAECHVPSLFFEKTRDKKREPVTPYPYPARLYYKRVIYDHGESGSFRSFSRSVRSFRPGSFRPDFWDESFRPSWGGSFRPYFIGGSFRPDFRGESFRPSLFILGKTSKMIWLKSPWFCFDKAGKSYVFDSVNIVKELISFWKIPPFLAT